MLHTLPSDPFPDEEVTKVDPMGPRAARHRMLLRAALLLHSGATWDPEKAAYWRQCTGEDEVSARVLCAAIRESGIRLCDDL